MVINGEENQRTRLCSMGLQSCPLWGVLPESETLPRSILRLSTLQGDLGQATERILGRKEKFTDWQMFSTVKLRSWRQQVFHSFFALLLVMDWWRLVDGSLSEDRSTTLSLFLSLKPRFFPNCSLLLSLTLGHAWRDQGEQGGSRRLRLVRKWTRHSCVCRKRTMHFVHTWIIMNHESHA